MSNTTFRRHLRRNSTVAEVILWQAIRNRQVKERKFRRQHTLGNYTVDFFCLEEMLVIELDGQSHQNTGTSQADEEQDKWLSEQGYKVLRFNNSEVYNHLERVIWAIEDTICASKCLSSTISPHPNLLPGEKGLFNLTKSLTFQLT